MDQAPNYYNYVSTQFGPSEQYQHQYHDNYNCNYNGNYHEQQHPPVDNFMNAVNAEVWAAVQASRQMDAQSLHIAYANLGFVLGIDKACTYFVQSYTSANPTHNGSRRTTKLFYKKDWENLEAMVADIDNEKKLIHVEQFMRRRRISGYVSSQEQKPIVCEKLVKQEKIEVMRLDVACQTQDKRDESVISLNVACQTDRFRGSEAGCQTEKFVGLDTACQTERFISLEVACQTVEKSKGLSVSCQTVEKSKGTSVSCQTVEKSKGTSVSCQTAETSDKSGEKIVRKDSESRKRPREDESKTCSVRVSESVGKVSSRDAKKSSSRTKERSENGRLSREKVEKIVRKDSSSRKRPREDEAETSAEIRQKVRKPELTKKSIAVTSKYNEKIENKENRSTVQAKVSSRVEKRLTELFDDKKSSSKSNDKTLRKDSSDNCKRDSKSTTRRSDSKHDATKSSALQTKAVDGKKSSSSKVADDSRNSGGVAETKKSSSPHREEKSSGCHVTKLVIQNLHPLVDAADISAIFSAFESYKSCKVNFYDYGKLCAAEVVFEDEADAVEAKNEYDGKILDGFPMHIVIVKPEKN